MKQIRNALNWLWEEIGRPIFLRHLQQTELKLIRLCITGMVTIAVGNPLLSWLVNLSVNVENGQCQAILNFVDNDLDLWTCIIEGFLFLITLILIWIRYQSLKNHKLQKSIVVMYGAKIASDTPLLSYELASKALPDDYEPAEGSPFTIQIESERNELVPQYWEIESENLKHQVLSKLVPTMQVSKTMHISLFALAPMPLLVLLGTLLNEKYSVEVYQLHREPKNWNRLKELGQKYIVLRPENANIDKQPVLVFSLSDTIIGRINKLYKDNANIWGVTVPNPNMDMMRSREQQIEFREVVRELLSEISRYSNYPEINVHMAMPIACAVELGRVWMPKAHKPLVLYDYQNKKEGKTITIKNV